ncbi:MAG: hypothetical protein HY376_02095 [Candidatus Blackburnbacteria bacterium]|nr:hypothetical protein [Candidatus Blackburnbacteria bacterium]
MATLKCQFIDDNNDVTSFDVPIHLGNTEVPFDVVVFRDRVTSKAFEIIVRPWHGVSSIPLPFTAFKVKRKLSTTPVVELYGEETDT